jgi:uncharacterized protein YndB with AHSA1/START domain
MNVALPASLRVSKIIAASRERLFRAWTDPKQLARWWHLQGEGWSFLDAEVDLRVGGGYRLGMTGPDGKTYVAVGEYREIHVPTRLLFSWHWVTASGRGPETLVTVEFNRTTDEETEVVLTHTRLADEQTAAGFRSGWSQLLTLLNEHIGRNKHVDQRDGRGLPDAFTIETSVGFASRR